MKKIKHFKPTLITKQFFSNYGKIEDINRGECFRWAFMAYLLFEGVEIWHTLNHAFVKYRGRFYDAERLRGEESWQDLPANARNLKDRRRSGPPRAAVDEKDFTASWDGASFRYNCPFKKMKTQAQKVLSEKAQPV